MTQDWMKSIDEVETLASSGGQSSVRKREDTLSCDLELALRCMGYFWASSPRNTIHWSSSNWNLYDFAAYLSMTSLRIPVNRR